MVCGWTYFYFLLSETYMYIRPCFCALGGVFVSFVCGTVHQCRWHWKDRSAVASHNNKQLTSWNDEKDHFNRLNRPPPPTHIHKHTYKRAYTHTCAIHKQARTNSHMHTRARAHIFSVLLLRNIAWEISDKTRLKYVWRSSDVDRDVQIQNQNYYFRNRENVIDLYIVIVTKEVLSFDMHDGVYRPEVWTRWEWEVKIIGKSSGVDRRERYMYY